MTRASATAARRSGCIHRPRSCTSSTADASLRSTARGSTRSRTPPTPRRACTWFPSPPSRASIASSPMKRIDIHYGGQLYSVGDRDVDQLLAEVEDGMRNGAWLKVNDGEGERRDAFLMLGPGVPISVIPIPGDRQPDMPDRD